MAGLPQSLSGPREIEIPLGGTNELIALRGVIVRDVAGAVAIRKTATLGLESEEHLRRLIQMNSENAGKVEREMSQTRSL